MLSYPWVCKRSIFHLVFVSVHTKEKGAPIAAKLCQRRASTGRSRESHGAECRWCRVSRAKVWYWDYVCQLWSKDCCDMDCKVRHGFGNRSWTIWRWRGWKEDNMMTCFLWKRIDSMQSLNGEPRWPFSLKRMHSNQESKFRFHGGWSPSPTPITFANARSTYLNLKRFSMIAEIIYQLISTFLMLEYHVTHEIHIEIPKTLCHWVHWHLRRSVTIPLCQCNCDRCRCGRSASASWSMRCDALWRH